MVAELESAEVSPLRSTGVMSSYGVGKFLAEFFTGAILIILVFLQMINERQNHLSYLQV
ncbi:MAG: hypothetical protein GOP50_06445 [Candidatus Heimdallarchaeota archaeon]|nr:hypothetical protein [Candidatus Heimdallarchaeota archaeon]